MTPQRKSAIIHELPTWTYRVIIAGAISIIMYFVMDIHQDFERQKEKVESLERKGDNHEYRIGSLESRFRTR